MFLATTGLTECWNADEELLLLGPWCLRRDRQQVWQGLRYQMLPNPWDDRWRMYEGIRYLEEREERLLRQLTDYLNGVHGTARSPRFWRLLIGPWLTHFLHATFDRFTHLQEALRRHPVIETIGMDESSYRVPEDTFQAVKWLSDDPYNLQLFTQLLQAMGQAVPTKPFAWPDQDRPGSRGPRRSRWFREWLNRASSAAGQVAFCDCYMPKRALMALALRRRIRALSFQPTFAHAPAARPVWDGRRLGLATLPAADTFEQMVVRLLPQHVPTLYLEDYDEASQELAKRYRRHPAVLVSGSGWFFNEPFKFLAAEAGERGGRLISAQHGGSYGMHAYVAQERHERTVADRCVVWGWAEGTGGRVVNAPSPHLSARLAPRAGDSAGQGILLVLTSHPRYLYRFHAMPAGSQWEAYFAWQVRFLEALPGSLRRAVCVRPYPEDYGRNVAAQIAERVPEVQWDAGQPIHQRLKTVRLAVMDHPITSWLEALSANVPTVLFWDPQRWEPRREATEELDRLRAANILHDTPEAAAARVASVYDTPSAWWNQQALQRAREQFVKRYALASADWLTTWSRLLAQELASGRTGPLPDGLPEEQTVAEEAVVNG